MGEKRGTYKIKDKHFAKLSKYLNKLIKEEKKDVKHNILG